MITLEEWNAKKKKRKRFYAVIPDRWSKARVVVMHVGYYGYNKKYEFLTAETNGDLLFVFRARQCFFSKKEAEEFARTMNED